jgi:HK97 family phage prohead protease
MSETLSLDEVRERLGQDPRNLDGGVRYAHVDADVRAVDDGKDGLIRFSGQASVFDSWSNPIKGFKERVLRGAFRSVLEPADVDIYMLMNHNKDMPLARTTVKDGEGSLTLSEGVRGLDTDAICAPTSYAKDLVVLSKTKVMTGMSFHYVDGVRDEWRAGDDGLLERTIRSFNRIVEVSPVIGPAYELATGSVRSILANPSDMDLAVLRDVAMKIHSGDLVVGEGVRHALDAAAEGLDTVTPWIAERALRAVAQAPEMLAAFQGLRASVEIEGERSALAGSSLLDMRERELRLMELED